MEIEKDNTIPFLDTSVSRDSNGLLTTSVYRKPTHTDQYLAYVSHHPHSVKRDIVKCLYDRTKHLTSKPSEALGIFLGFFIPVTRNPENPPWGLKRLSVI